MTRFMFSVVSAGSLLVIGPTVLSADSPPEGTEAAASAYAGQTIGLIDVGHIMKNYERLREQKDAMLAGLKAAERETTHRRKAIDEMKQQLSLVPVGSPEYKDLREQIDMSELRLAQLVRAQRTTFVQREAQIYHETYTKIHAEAEGLGRSRGLDMVLNFSRSPYDAADPKTIVPYINRPVIWHKGQCDLTDIVFERMNAGSTEEAPEPKEEEAPEPTEEKTTERGGEIVEPPPLPDDS